MQVKRAIGKATLHKLPIYNELSLHIILHDLLFVFQLVKALLHVFDPYI